MKMRKSTSKILSLVLVLSFVFSLSAVTASAADTNEQDELVTFILEYDKSCEVYELSDGTTVVFGVIPAASTYAGSYNNNYGLRRGSQPRLFPSQSRSC